PYPTLFRAREEIDSEGEAIALVAANREQEALERLRRIAGRTTVTVSGPGLGDGGARFQRAPDLGACSDAQSHVEQEGFTGGIRHSEAHGAVAQTCFLSAPRRDRGACIATDERGETLLCRQK